MGQIRSLSFLSPGNFPDDDPYAGLEETLRLFEYGERLGFDGAWISAATSAPTLAPYRINVRKNSVVSL